METGIKLEALNTNPLPQRNQQKNPNQQNVQQQQQDLVGKKKQQDGVEIGGGVPEKKPRFSVGGGNQNLHQNQQNQNQNQQGQQGGNRNNRLNRFGQGGNRGGQGGGNPNQRNNSQNRNFKVETEQSFGDAGNRGNDRGGNAGDRGNFGGDRGGNRRSGGRDRDDDRGRSGYGGGGGFNRKADEFMIANKLKNLQGPTHELEPIDAEETKFSGRNRLYIGNLTNDITEQELVELFKPFGEIGEVFINPDKRNFAFLKVDYHAGAEKAKRELDGVMRKNRTIKVRFAPNSTVVRVKNLTQFVSNELLFKSFEIFGPVERAVIIVNERGQSTGEGIVEFARKNGALCAIKYCTEKCFFLTESLRPCVVEQFEINDEIDGLPDKQINKKSQEFYKARDVGPRFAETGSFEHEYGTRWKQLHELFRQKQEALKRELILEEEKLEAQMALARFEHETAMLREQLRQREQERDRTKIEWEMKERQAEQMRTRDEEEFRRHQEEIQLRMTRQDEEMRRRQQENTLFMQAQQLSSLLDQQEIQQGVGGENLNGSGNRNFGDFGGGGNNIDGGNQEQGFIQFDNANRFDDQNQGPNVGGGGPMDQRGGGNNRNWTRGNDFQNKRRHF